MNLKHIGGTFLVGAFSQWGPHIVKGAMNEYLHLLTVRDFVAAVQNDKPLFELLEPDQQQMIMKSINKLGDLSWFTLDWVIENGRTAAPAIHSMLVSWPESQEWLKKNIVDLKERGGQIG